MSPPPGLPMVRDRVISRGVRDSFSIRSGEILRAFEAARSLFSYFDKCLIKSSPCPTYSALELVSLSEEFVHVSSKTPSGESARDFVFCLHKWKS